MLLRFCIVAAMLAAAPAGASPVAERDDRDVLITLPKPASRIITLSPHLAELVFAAGAGDRIVGAVRYSDYPAAAVRIPRVGDSSRVNAERVLQLRPDLVLAWQSGNQATDIARLERLGLAVFVTEAQRLSDVPRLLGVVGRLAGSDDVAARESDNFNNKIKYLEDNYRAARPVRVFYEIWHRPLITVSGGHMIDDVLRLCGGRNVFAHARGLTPTVSIEAVLAARPAVILGGASAGGARDFIERWKHSASADLRGLPLRHVDPDLIQRATPRISEGAAVVCAQLDGVRRGAVNPDPGNSGPAAVAPLLP